MECIAEYEICKKKIVEILRGIVEFIGEIYRIITEIGRRLVSATLRLCCKRWLTLPLCCKRWMTTFMTEILR